MPTYTEKLHLEKPNENEYYDVEVFNANYDKIDDAIDEASKQGGLYLGDEPPAKASLWVDTSEDVGGGTFVDLYKMEVNKVPIEGLNTTDKTVEGAINEVDERINKNTISTSTRVVLSNNVEYETQADGYFVTSITTTGEGNNKFISMYVGSVTVAKNLVQAGEYNMVGLFVRKGSKIKYWAGTGITDLSKVAGVFYPLT